ncbi:MAG TPA: hypothetical protein VGH65_04295 [Verrucomicrobiaceae bacterium]|jgi:hypothetical protein
MRVERLLLILLLALSLEAQAAAAQPIPSEQDHLVPVHPYPSDWHIRYNDQVRRLFKLAPPFYLQMLVLPSFTPEYVVRMHGNEKNPWDINEADQVFLSRDPNSKIIL